MDDSVQLKQKIKMDQKKIIEIKHRIITLLYEEIDLPLEESHEGDEPVEDMDWDKAYILSTLLVNFGVLAYSQEEFKKLLIKCYVDFVEIKKEFF